MWHYVLSRIWRNLHRDIEIDRNWESEESLKLGGGQKIFHFYGERDVCPRGGVHTPLHTMAFNRSGTT